MADPSSDGNAPTFEEIVRRYETEHKTRAEKEERYFSKPESIRNVVEKAVRSMMPSRRGMVLHPHQRRIGYRKLEAALELLRSRERQIVEANTFGCLYDEIACAVAQSGIRGIGPLTIYDIAHRIGTATARPPDMVYLHAGTARGARFIVDTRGRKTIAIDEFPTAFRRLNAAHLENCLCIFAHDIARAAF